MSPQLKSKTIIRTVGDEASFETVKNCHLYILHVPGKDEFKVIKNRYGWHDAESPLPIKLLSTVLEHPHGRPLIVWAYDDESKP